MKVSILMPTYNDAKSICETLDSVISQTLSDFELLIMDDGSKDNTREVIKNYKKEKDKNNKIKYFYQENQDQLNAIYNLLDKVQGEYIYVLHSDDLLANNNVLERCTDYMDKNPNVDSIISDLIIIDENSKETGIQKVKEYINKESTLALQELWLGRNLYVDVGFHRKESYLKNNKQTYLTWNMPFWIKINENNLEMLNVKKVDFQSMKYRVFGDNYINNEIGKLNVINGELRTITTIMKYFNIPNYKLQYTLFRLLNKFKLAYRPIYKKEEQKNKGEIIRFVIEKRFGEEYKNNLFLNAIVNFYEKNNEREYVIDRDLSNEFIYKGKDMRRFNDNLVKNEISEFYKEFLENMTEGFNKIICSEKQYESVCDVCKFMCIYPYVKIEVKK